jgi:type II secretory pathway pseudopilin PulG
MWKSASPNKPSRLVNGWHAFAAERRRHVVPLVHAHAAARREHATRCVRPTRYALTLMEVVVSTLIVGMMTVAALDGLGSTTRSSELAGNRGIALGLADELMAEILSTRYSEPTGTAVFGTEPGETAPRTNFDDVDDFHGWNQQPPKAADGTTIPDRANYRQRITVERVAPANPTQTVATEQGAKRIRVIVECDDVVLAEQYAVVTDTDE